MKRISESGTHKSAVTPERPTRAEQTTRQEGQLPIEHEERSSDMFEPAQKRQKKLEPATIDDLRNNIDGSNKGSIEELKQQLGQIAPKMTYEFLNEQSLVKLVGLAL